MKEKIETVSKYQCDYCGIGYKFKTALVDHIIEELESGSSQADTARNQLDELEVDIYD